MKYVAFLRAINVGKRRVKMDILCRQFEALGFLNVHSYIQSGNVVFEALAAPHNQLEREIEEQLQEALGFEVPAMVRTARQVQDVLEHQPFPEETIGERDTLYVSFLKEVPAKEKQEALLSQTSDIDVFHIYDHHLYWLYHRGLGESEFTNAKIEKILKVSATRRNINTVRKLAKKYF